MGLTASSTIKSMQVTGRLVHSGGAAKPAAAQDTSTPPVKYLFAQFHHR